MKSKNYLFQSHKRKRGEGGRDSWASVPLLQKQRSKRLVGRSLKRNINNKTAVGRHQGGVSAVVEWAEGFRLSKFLFHRVASWICTRMLWHFGTHFLVSVRLIRSCNQLQIGWTKNTANGEAAIVARSDGNKICLQTPPKLNNDQLVCLQTVWRRF